MSSSNSSTNGSPPQPKRRHLYQTTSESSSALSLSSLSHSLPSSEQFYTSGTEGHSIQSQLSLSDVQDDEDEQWVFSPYIPGHLVEHYHQIQTELTNNNITSQECDSLFFDGQRSLAILQFIGKGTFSRVFRGAEVNATAISDRFVAIKVIIPNVWNTDSLNREISVVDTLIGNPHKNIIRYREHFQYLSPAHFIISDLATTDLKVLLTSTNDQGEAIWTILKPQYCRHLIRGVAEGVAHLHTLGIAHGDIKLENIMVTEGPLQEADPLNHLNHRIMRMTPKLIDFSNSEREEPGEPILRNQPRCSLYTAAPESMSTDWSPPLWLPQTPFDMIKADVYSVGAVLLSTLLSCYPFKAPTYVTDINERKRISIIMKNDTNLLKQLVQPFDYILKKVLLRLLEPLPQNRITIHEFLADEWFTQGMASQEWHYEEQRETTQRKGLPHHQQRRRSIQREFQFKDENQ